MSVKKGDPVRVRLANGEVVDAVYKEPSVLAKCHHVDICGNSYLALGGNYARCKYLLPHECRFVGPTPTINLNNRGEKTSGGGK